MTVPPPQYIPAYVQPMPPPRRGKGAIITLSILLGVSVIFSLICLGAYGGSTSRVDDCQNASIAWEEAAYADTEDEFNDAVDDGEYYDSYCFG